ncbi:MAG: signal peptidase [Solirubrobacteraceae bacterium]|nr:signal peptidase [Solirubrobacteraceae bacterium]
MTIARRAARRPAALLGLLALVIAGCGSSSSGDSASAVNDAFARYAHAMAHGDAATACRKVTSGYWKAILAELDAAYEGQGAGRFPVRDCQTGLTYVFRNAGRAPVNTSGYRLTDVSVRGATATAVETKNGAPGAQLRFLRTGATWLLDCCTGSQNDRQAQVRYRVPSAAMVPALAIGQTVIADNVVLRHRPPALYEIVTFHPPSGVDHPDASCAATGEGGAHLRPCGVSSPGASAQTYIKRVVGLPGDRIAIVDGVVIRNGHRETSPRIEPCTSEAGCNFPQAIVVPPGTYYFLGDNRPSSNDSRFWGPVKRAWILGLITP